MATTTTPEVTPATTRKPWKLAVKIIGSLVAVVGILLTGYQLGLNKETNDRAAGRVTTEFKAIRVEPQFTSADSRRRYKRFDQFGDIDFVYFQSVDDLCEFNPRILIKNTGDEVVESVRVEVEEIMIIPLIHGRPPVFIPPFKPIAEPSVLEEYPLTERLKPGDCATLPVYRPLLKSLLLAQRVRDNQAVQAASQGKKLDVYAIFELRVYAKAFGMSGYDRPSNESPSEKFPIIWDPSGFTEEGCKRYFDLRPTVRIGEEAKILAPTMRAKKL